MIPIGNPLVTKALGILSGVLALLLIGSTVLNYKYKAEVALLERDKAELQADLDVLNVNKKTCENAIADQNARIEENRLDYETKLANMKPVTTVRIVEKLKIKYVDRNISKESCNETASVIDAIRRTGF